MQLATRYKHLFDYDMSRIIEAACALGCDEWSAWNYRQKTFGAHQGTQTFPFLYSRNWHRLDTSDPIEEHNANSLAWMSVRPLVDSLESHYGGVVVAAMLVRLLPRQHIARHKDSGARLELSHRCHAPVVTNSQVEFLIDDERVPFCVGGVYEIDNTRLHAVNNKSDQARIHLIVDVAPIDRAAALPKNACFSDSSVMII